MLLAGSTYSMLERHSFDGEPASAEPQQSRNPTQLGCDSRILVRQMWRGHLCRWYWRMCGLHVMQGATVPVHLSVYVLRCSTAVRVGSPRSAFLPSANFASTGSGLDAGMGGNHER